MDIPENARKDGHFHGHENVSSTRENDENVAATFSRPAGTLSRRPTTQVYAIAAYDYDCNGNYTHHEMLSWSITDDHESVLNAFAALCKAHPDADFAIHHGASCDTRVGGGGPCVARATRIGSAAQVVK